MKKRTIRFFHNEKGLTTIEYSIAAMLIAMSVMIGADYVSSKIDDKFSTISNALITQTDETEEAKNKVSHEKVVVEELIIDE